LEDVLGTDLEDAGLPEDGPCKSARFSYEAPEPGVDPPGVWIYEYGGGSEVFALARDSKDGCMGD